MPIKPYVPNETRKCLSCGKEFTLRITLPYRFCSMACSKKGEHNPMYKDNRSNDKSKLPKGFYATQKYKTRSITAYSVKIGRIKRKSCEVCGSQKSEVHHPDYSDPYKIQWLCKKHHKEAHGGFFTLSFKIKKGVQVRTRWNVKVKDSDGNKIGIIIPKHSVGEISSLSKDSGGKWSVKFPFGIYGLKRGSIEPLTQHSE